MFTSFNARAWTFQIFILCNYLTVPVFLLSIARGWTCSFPTSRSDRF